MRRYDHLKDHPRDFLAATGLTPAEFARLLPAFEAAYDDLYPPHLTATGQARQRQGGVVRKEGWRAGKISCCLFWFIKKPTPCRQCRACILG